MMTSDRLSPRSSTIISTHAFQDYHNNRPASRESVDSFAQAPQISSDDIFDSIVPELTLDSGHLMQGSISSSGLTSDAPTTREDEESSFGDLPPMLWAGFSNIGNTPENSAPSPERNSTRPSSKQRMSIPARRSSRVRGESNASSSDFVNSDTHDDETLRRTTTTDTEATRQSRSTSELNGHGTAQQSRKASVQTDRSATPPPIGRLRRRIDNDSDSSDTAQNHTAASSETAVFLQEASQLLPVARRHSQASLASHQSQRSLKARSHHAGSRVSGAEHKSSRESNLLPPGTRHSSRPQSRKDSVRDLKGVYEDTGLFPRHAPAATHESGGTPRHSSLVTSSSTLRPTSTAKRVFSSDAFPTSRALPADRHSIISHGSSTRLPDFFSYEIFQVVLRNPTTAHQLFKFSESRLCGENIEFLNKVDEYQTLLRNITDVLGKIHKGFISSHSTNRLDVPTDVMRSVSKDVKTLAGKTLPGMETLFTDMQARIEELVFTDVYPRFVRHQLALSATRALANDRHRYAGLGDCFCLTNPNKADNPIVFASDGFVKVTGYSRPEIIPRNCRFLQGPQTDRGPIRQLKKGIAECRESVELILNYKKNGDPFWNLLYVAPLFNEHGKLAFFIGGQVNCSTTIQSHTDVMKVLSLPASGEIDDSSRSISIPTAQKQGALPSAKKAILKAFGVRVDEAKVMTGSAGIEDEVLGRMEGQKLDAQMKEFYTAYSKYLVVQADTFIIHYYSEGVLEILNPANNTGLTAGQEVFRFFKQNMVGKETDYRSKVRSAVRSGNPISVELRLQTRRSAKFRGDEAFATHWTPLKDERAATQWVVIALASTIF